MLSISIQRFEIRSIRFYIISVHICFVKKTYHNIQLWSALWYFGCDTHVPGPHTTRDVVLFQCAYRIQLYPKVHSMSNRLQPSLGPILPLYSEMLFVWAPDFLEALEKRVYKWDHKIDTFAKTVKYERADW